MALAFRYAHQMACEPDSRYEIVSWGGIFAGENPMQKVLPFIMLRLSLFFIVSNALRYLLKPLKQTKFICNALTGIILGTPVLGLYKEYALAKGRPRQVHFLNLAAFYGLSYHVFLITVKIDARRILKIGNKARVIGLATCLTGFIVMAALNFILHPLTFKIPSDRYTLSSIASCNSILNIAPMLEQFNLLTTELGQVAVSASLIADIVAVFSRVLHVFRASVTMGFVKVIIPLGVLIACKMYVLRPIMQWIIRETPSGHRVKEIYVVGVLVVAGVISALWDVIVGLPTLGIMLFGLMVPNGPPLGSSIVELGEMFIDNCLLPFFFLGIGDMVNFHAVKDWKGHLMFELVLVLGYLTMTIIATLLGLTYNMSHRQSIALGFIMNAPGVMEIGIFWVMWLRQRWDVTFCSMLVLSSIVKGALVAPLAVFFYRNVTKPDDSIRDFELSIQAASTGAKMRVLACVNSEEDVPGFITLFEALNPTEANPIDAYVIHFNELLGQALPILTPHKKHKRICKHNGCFHISNALKVYCDDSEGRVNLRFLTMITPFKNMHEGLCRLAQDETIPLILVPFLYRSLAPYRQRIASKDLNRKIQAQAPCTVGVLVDRGTTLKNQNQQYFSYKVVVIFFGGEDDREVLAFATRMSGHPGVSIVMLRIIVQAYQDMSTEDKHLDETLVDGFKSKIIDNACAVFREVRVEDWLQAVQVIQSMEKDYDLVVVGRRHGESSIQEKQLFVLSESPELGFIGETLASAELQSRDFSVLVMQHCTGVDREALGNLMLVEDDD